MEMGMSKSDHQQHKMFFYVFTKNRAHETNVPDYTGGGLGPGGLAQEINCKTRLGHGER
jgi:hypothetical protein